MRTATSTEKIQRVMQLTSVDRDTADDLLSQSNNDVTRAVRLHELKTEMAERLAKFRAHHAEVKAALVVTNGTKDSPVMYIKEDVANIASQVTNDFIIVTDAETDALMMIRAQSIHILKEIDLENDDHIRRASNNRFI